MTVSNRRRDLCKLALALPFGLSGGLSPAARAARRPLRIFHVMSFDSPWRWTDEQFGGFRAGLDLPDVEYRVFQMDVKRNSTPAAKESRASQARGIIEDWRPDLVYTTDDDAQQYVTRHFVGSTIPFVFSGVNKAPGEHGLAGAPNVTGVLEQEHFVESVRLLQQLAPDVSRLAVIGDEGIQWPPVIKRIRAQMSRLPGVSLVSVDRLGSFGAFRQRMGELQEQADAIVQLGIFGLDDGRGENLPYRDVLRWVVEHSRLPDISFWVDRVHNGVLASVAVSGFEQGLAAGRLARRILLEGQSPADLPMTPSVKGHPVVNLARIEQLGLQASSTLLLSSEVARDYAWAREGR